MRKVARPWGADTEEQCEPNRCRGPQCCGDDGDEGLAPQDVAHLHCGPIATAGGLNAASGQRAGDAAHAADAARLDFLDDGPDVGGECATGLDGGPAGYGEARATELDAAALGSR